MGHAQAATIGVRLMKKENLEEKNIMAEIAKAIMKLNYGEVRIIIHDAKIVQIEKIEKKRFQN